ncbi:MAG: MBL fold metallo-hydrolase [Candidatus Helarchaeota archaeon]
MKNFFFIKADKPIWPASANVVAIKDENGFILIDVGCGLRKFTKKLFRKLEDIGIQLKDIHTIVISHAHPDHMGAMSTIFKEFTKIGKNSSDLKIFINELEKNSALNIKLLNKSFDVDLLIKYFKEKEDNPFKLGFDINDNFKILCAMSQLPEDCNITTFKDGDIIELGEYKFRIINTPGHSPGHTSFYEINHQFLLSGDLIGEKGVAWYSPSSGGAIGYLNSLDKIEKLSIKCIYPSHGNMFYNVNERINEIRNKILLKDKIIMDKLEKEPTSVLNLVSLFYVESYAQIFPGVVIVESHLQKLEQEGKIRRKDNLIYKI